jgi:hypothetical protein
LPISDCRFPISIVFSDWLQVAQSLINWQSAIGNRKFLFEWLADPGCSPSGSNADLKPPAVRALPPGRSESYALLLATFSNRYLPG